MLNISFFLFFKLNINIYHVSSDLNFKLFKLDSFFFHHIKRQNEKVLYIHFLFVELFSKYTKNTSF